MLDQIVLLQFLTPVFWAVGFFAFPWDAKKFRVYSLVGSVIFLVNTIRLVMSAGDLGQLTILGKYNLSNFFGLSYTLGIDGLSSILIILNALLLIIVVLATWDFETRKTKLYYFSIFALAWAVNGSLLAINLFAFYIFWEAMLIPLFILVGVFGGANRKYASYKFFIYTAAGSIFMLAAMIYMSAQNYKLTETYDLTAQTMKALNLPFDGLFSPQSLIFWAFCLAFFIKVPVFPFHSWLPDAHVEAPTAGSIILAGVLLKLGIYGLLRFVIPVFPEAVQANREFIMVLGAIGIIYGSLTALAQTDIKKVVAFSSIGHMGYIVAGVFALNEQAMSGAIFQMIAHGITTGGLFVAVNCLYMRRHTKDIAAYGGVAKVMPVFAVAFFLMILGSMAVPLTNGFVGEFMIIFGVFKANKTLGILCATGVILGPLYLLTMFQKTMLGQITDEENKHLKDISVMELMPFVILAVFVILHGVYPDSLISLYKGTLKSILGL